jgi:hypothetical protein
VGCSHSPSVREPARHGPTRMGLDRARGGRRASHAGSAPVTQGVFRDRYPGDPDSAGKSPASGALALPGGPVHLREYGLQVSSCVTPTRCTGESPGQAWIPGASYDSSKPLGVFTCSTHFPLHGPTVNHSWKRRTGAWPSERPLSGERRPPGRRRGPAEPPPASTIRDEGERASDRGEPRRSRVPVGWRALGGEPASSRRTGGPARRSRAAVASQDRRSRPPRHRSAPRRRRPSQLAAADGESDHGGRSAARSGSRPGCQNRARRPPAAVDGRGR